MICIIKKNLESFFMTGFEKIREAPFYLPNISKMMMNRIFFNNTKTKTTAAAAAASRLWWGGGGICGKSTTTTTAYLARRSINGSSGIITGLRIPPNDVGGDEQQQQKYRFISSAIPSLSSSSPPSSLSSSHQHDNAYENDEEWIQAFTDATVGIAEMDDPSSIDYETSSQRLRTLLKTKLLKHDDLHVNPERFFLAHRILAKHSSKVGPGFWVRFTVHYNLCVGTILALGTEQQIAELEKMQTNGELGCFALTEKLAGVNSGLIVNTTATYDTQSKTFTINSPNLGAQKNWISQGLVADKTVVIADLHIGDNSYGPHAFVMYLRDPVTKELLPGITTEDMGIKTVGNDLDNASIAFDNVVIPKSALLSRFADIMDDEEDEYDDDAATYVQKIDGLPVFHMIGQRLFTGRVAVAQAAMQFRHGLFEKTKEFTDSKKCWSPGSSTKELHLSDIPQLKALYERATIDAIELDTFVNECERRLCECLKTQTLPSIELVEAIACAKVQCVERSIQYCHQLQNDVGSYALMSGTGFENIDFLTCCKFAEGDSRILMQKMSRDRMKQFQKKFETGDGDKPPKGVDAVDWELENQTCYELQTKMLKIMTEDGVDKQVAWDECWEDVYHLADIIMNRTMKSFMSSMAKKKNEVVTEPSTPTETVA